ncbi:hypothetical protein [Halomonas alimentaria]|uniref:EpsG family protein n=1 Tax=Halomonas alimentaria TaxID=147248 RepID=A0A7X5AQR4_9GAMM|nr:hypothetical protein [Halomonas alimentaria]NAW34727.1 hypothetical protein [Halomonas alimentaria]
MKINKNLAFCIICFPFFYIGSYVLISHYIGGDQVHYRAFYDALSSASYDAVMLLARGYVSSAEPITAYALWFGARAGFSKDVFISLINATFLTFFLLFLRRNRVHPVFVLLLLSNFYIIVILTGAERLKFAYFLFIVSALIEGRSRFFIIMASPAAHLQSFVFIPAIAIYSYAKKIFEILFTWRLNARFAIAFFCAAGLLVFLLIVFFQALLTKAGYYFSNDLRFSSLLQVFALSLISFPLLKNKMGAVLLFVYFSVAILLLGGERVNMIAFSVFTFYLLKERAFSSMRVINLPYLAALAYFSFKSFGFIRNIMLYGNGFYSV